MATATQTKPGNLADPDKAHPVATQAPPSLVARIGDRFGVDPSKLLATLRQTAFKQGKGDPEPTNEEMMALLVVADQYGLNPFTRELFAFLDARRGVVPVVSVDGWIRIINQHPAMNGIKFLYPDADGDGTFPWIECQIARKDRDEPTCVREFFSEVKRNTGPWASHPRRMHRHKALIQGARVAFGFAGIYDEDEAERILEASVVSTVAPAGKGGEGLKKLLGGVAPEATAAPAEAASDEPAPKPWAELTAKDKPNVWVDLLASLKDPAEHQAMVEFAMGLEGTTDEIVNALEAKRDELVFGK